MKFSKSLFYKALFPPSSSKIKKAQAIDKYAKTQIMFCQHANVKCRELCSKYYLRFTNWGKKPQFLPIHSVPKIAWIFTVSADFYYKPFSCLILANLGVRGSSVSIVRDSCWGGHGFDSRCGRPLANGWVGASIMWPAETEVM